jgi:hypothetical protein
MPLPVLDKANKIPIATIVKWFLEREKGKVVESRQEIQRRFGGLDWSIQKIVISAFLSSGKADRKWVYEQIVWLWDNDFFPKLKEVFEKYHEKGCYRPVTWYFPTSYILEHFDELAVEHNYYSLCYRLAYEKIDFEPDRKKLSPKEYLAIIELAHKTLQDDEAIEILFDVLHVLFQVRTVDALFFVLLLPIAVIDEQLHEYRATGYDQCAPNRVIHLSDLLR